MDYFEPLESQYFFDMGKESGPEKKQAKGIQLMQKQRAYQKAQSGTLQSQRLATDPQLSDPQLPDAPKHNA